MKKIFTTLLLLAIVGGSIFAQSPKREMRAVWFTTWLSDFTSTRVPVATGSNEAARETARTTQKNDLISSLNNLQKENINTVFFHVRPMCDAIYKSSYEPWSQYISAVRGSDPGWDPLAFVIEEAHKRGMELHPWINPYRYSQNSGNHGNLATDYANAHPNWLLDYGSYAKILNPGMPEVVQRISDIVAEIVTNYDVDGIVFDDYFYVSGTTNVMDQAQFDAYNPNGLSRGDWRRANVNKMVKTVYDRIQSIKPYVTFGISPAGVAKGGAAAVGLTQSIGSDWQYNDIYSDPLAWLHQGTVDYISPQIYWAFGHSTNDYGQLSKWWSQAANKFGRHFYSSQNQFGIPEIGNEIDANRNYDLNDAPGSVFFRTINLTSTSIINYLTTNHYRYKALPPAISWKPAPNQDLVGDLTLTGQNLKWTHNDSVRYVIYAAPISSTDPLTSSLHLQGISYTYQFTLPTGINASSHRIAVSVLDRYGNEFAPRVLGEDKTPPKIVSYDPQGNQEESARPIVRIEFDKPLNEATLADKIAVKDKNGNSVSGTQNYYVAENNKSVMHYIFDADLKPQEKYTVTLAAGIEDMAGNAMPAGKTFDFTPKPRKILANIMLEDFKSLTTPGDWRNATQIGGLRIPPSIAAIDGNMRPTKESTGSLKMTYQWTSGVTTGEWRFHAYNPNTSLSNFIKKADRYIQFYLFGDGSHTNFRVVLQRVDVTPNTYYAKNFVMDWVGWKIIRWDLDDDNIVYPWLGGSGGVPSDVALCVKSLHTVIASSEHVTYTPSNFWVSQIQAVGEPEITPTDRIVAAYYSPFAFKQIPDPNYFTHFYYCFFEPNMANGQYNGFTVPNESKFAQIVALKEKKPDLKISIVFGGANAFAALTKSDEYRKAFALDCKNFLQERGIDGVDMNWEFPNDAEEGNNFTLLMKQLRETLGNEYLLTYAGACGSSNINIAAVAPYVDYINVMTYNMYYSRVDREFNHHSALKSSKTALDCERSVQMYLNAGVPAYKLVLGVPFYGRQPLTLTSYHYSDIINLDPQTYKIDNWDDEASVPYATLDGKFYFGYDNERSIAIKGEWLLKKGLRGMMYWQHESDDSGASLRKAAWQAVMQDTSFDTMPPKIVSYDPQNEQEISARPIVRIEFDEQLNESSITTNQITVKDKNGDIVQGEQSYHVAINSKSAMHYIFTDDLKPQETYTVTFASGIEDLYGNAMPEGIEFTFTARPKEIKESVMLESFTSLGQGDWRNGSQTTLVAESAAAIDESIRAVQGSPGSLRLIYQWDWKKWTYFGGEWRLNAYTDNHLLPNFTKSDNSYIQFYLLGDGSGTRFSPVLQRAGANPNTFYAKPIAMDWVGWKLITWDLNDSEGLENPWFEVAGNIPSEVLCLKSLHTQMADPLELMSSRFWVSQIRAVELGDYIPGKGSETKRFAMEADITVYTATDYIQVISPEDIKAIKVYSITGALLKSAQPEQPSCRIPTSGWMQGVYIVKVATETSQKNAKVLVR